MRHHKLTIAVLALSAVACDVSVTDPDPEREITLHFCGPVWAAFQNEGDPWESFPSAPTEVTFSATERLAIAAVSRVGQSLEPLLEIYYLTAEQAEATFTCAAPQASSKRLHGSVAGLSLGANVGISMGRGIVGASAAFPTFQVRAPLDGPADLIATHRPPFESTPPSGRADKIIIRRDENHVDGATMPVLDFSSFEAFAPQSNTLTVQGLSAGTTLSVQTHVTTGRGASTFLKYDFDQSSAVVTTYSLPANRIVDGDLHQVNADTRGRGILFFYRNPTDRTLALGPAASTPVFTTTGSASVAAQPEYGSQISIVLSPPQPSTSSNTVVIRATREHFGGTPATWSLVLPDLTGVPGFSPLWGPAPGGNGWTLTASNLPYGFSSASARDGDVYRSASAFGVTFIATGTGAIGPSIGLEGSK